MEIYLFQVDLTIEFDDALITQVDGEELLLEYHQRSTAVLHKHAPLVDRNRSARETRPWYTDHIHALGRRRRALWRKWIKSGLEIDKQIYVDHLKMVAKEIRAAKSKYYTESLSKADTKTTFEIIHSLKLHSKLHSLLQKEDRKLPKFDSAKTTCSAFSTFFVDKIDKIMMTIHDTVQSESLSLPDLPQLDRSPPTLEHLHPTDEAENNHDRTIKVDHVLWMRSQHRC